MGEQGRIATTHYVGLAMTRSGTLHQACLTVRLRQLLKANSLIANSFPKVRGAQRAPLQTHSARNLLTAYRYVSIALEYQREQSVGTPVTGSSSWVNRAGPSCAAITCIHFSSSLS